MGAHACSSTCMLWDPIPVCWMIKKLSDQLRPCCLAGQLTGFRIRSHVSTSTIIILETQNIQKQILQDPQSSCRVQHSVRVVIWARDDSSVKSILLTTITH